jgi:hypothetical protein
VARGGSIPGVQRSFGENLGAACMTAAVSGVAQLAPVDVHVLVQARLRQPGRHLRVVKDAARLPPLSAAFLVVTC